MSENESEIDMPFPTPDEVNDQRRKILEPQVERLRTLVEGAFKARPNHQGEYIVDKPKGADALDPEAYRIVEAELNRSGWAVRSPSSFGGSAGWIISKQRGRD